MRALLTMAIAATLAAAPAGAQLRSPQVPVTGAALQAFFTAQGQAIDVATRMKSTWGALKQRFR